MAGINRRTFVGGAVGALAASQVQTLTAAASESAQKLCGRAFVLIVALAALVVASFAKDALVMLGGLAVAYGFQMFPALMGACYFPWLSRRGIAMGLVAGLLGGTLTDSTVAWVGVPWGKYPLTIHSAGGGILFNLLFAIGGAFLLPDSAPAVGGRVSSYVM